jgi:flagellar biosynthetic protein FliR
MADLLLQQFGEQQLAGFFLVLARLAPLFVLAPLFSSKMVPGRVRIVIAVGLAIGLTPVVVGGDQKISMDAWTYAGLILKELLIGGAFAFALGAMFAAIGVAGTFLDYFVGLAFGSLVDPVTGTNSTIISQLYTLIGVVIFIAIGGEDWVIAGFARTFDIVGLTETPSLGTLVAGANDAFVGIFSAAVQIAGPIMLAMVLTDAAFGVVSRVVPQLNVFGVGFPVKLILGVLLIGVTLPYLGGWISGELTDSVSVALHTLKVA